MVMIAAANFNTKRAIGGRESTKASKQRYEKKHKKIYLPGESTHPPMSWIFGILTS